MMYKQGGAEVACLAHNRKVEGSKPSPAIVVSQTLNDKWSHSVVVSTSDFESGNPSSNLGGTYFFLVSFRNLFKSQ